VKISIKINKYIPWIGFPPSSVGAFHFNVTEDLSNLVISRSRGSLGASTYQRSHVCKRMLMIERMCHKNTEAVFICNLQYWRFVNCSLDEQLC